VTNRVAPPTYRILSPVQNLLETGDGDSLQTINTFPLPNGSVCWVVASGASFRLFKNSVTPADNITILAPSAGPGRWFIETNTGSGGFQWQDQAGTLVASRPLSRSGGPHPVDTGTSIELLDGNIDVLAWGSLSAAVAAAGATTGQTLLLVNQSYVIDADITDPTLTLKPKAGAVLTAAANRTIGAIDFSEGGVIRPANGVVVTINGPITIADTHFAFDISVGGSFAFGLGALERFNARNFGAQGDGVADDYAAIQAALDATVTGYLFGHSIELDFSEGIYLHSQPLVWHGIAGGRIRGAGATSTLLKYFGAAGVDISFKVLNCRDCVIEGIGIFGDGGANPPNFGLGIDMDLTIDGGAKLSTSICLRDSWVSNFGQAALLITYAIEELGGGIVTASNATPIEITTATAHGLTTGAQVVIEDVVGNDAVFNMVAALLPSWRQQMGFWTITKTGDTSFTLDGSIGIGAGTGGKVIRRKLNGGQNNDQHLFDNCFFNAADGANAVQLGRPEDAFYGIQNMKRIVFRKTVLEAELNGAGPGSYCLMNYGADVDFSGDWEGGGWAGYFQHNGSDAIRIRTHHEVSPRFAVFHNLGRACVRIEGSEMAGGGAIQAVDGTTPSGIPWGYAIQIYDSQGPFEIYGNAIGANRVPILPRILYDNSVSGGRGLIITQGNSLRATAANGTDWRSKDLPLITTLGSKITVRAPGGNSYEIDNYGAGALFERNDPMPLFDPKLDARLISWHDARFSADVTITGGAVSAWVNRGGSGGATWNFTDLGNAAQRPNYTSGETIDAVAGTSWLRTSAAVIAQPMTVIYKFKGGSVGNQHIEDGIALGTRKIFTQNNGNVELDAGTLFQSGIVYYAHDGTYNILALVLNGAASKIYNQLHPVLTGNAGTGSSSGATLFASGGAVPVGLATDCSVVYRLMYADALDPIEIDMIAAGMENVL